MYELEALFVEILDTERGDGACALSLLQNQIAGLETAIAEFMLSLPPEELEFTLSEASEIDELVERVINKLDNNAKDNRQDSGG